MYERIRELGWNDEYAVIADSEVHRLGGDRRTACGTLFEPDHRIRVGHQFETDAGLCPACWTAA